MKFKKGDRVTVYGFGEVKKGAPGWREGDYVFSNGHRGTFMGYFVGDEKSDDQGYVKFDTKDFILKGRLESSAFAGGTSYVHVNQLRKLKKTKRRASSRR